MTKKEFMQRLSAETGLTQVLLNRIFDSALDIIAEELKSGGKVILKDLGVFRSKWLKERRKITPQGEVVTKRAGLTPAFKFSKDFKERF